MSTKELTCAQRVYDNMLERESEISKLINDPESDWSDDPALSIDTKRFTKVCLSYGGPADYLEIYWDNDGIERVIYRFSDWFDTATWEIYEDSALWRYAEFIVEAEMGRE